MDCGCWDQRAAAAEELNGRGGPDAVHAVYCCLVDDVRTSAAAAAAAGKLEENGAPRREVIAPVHPEMKVYRKPIPYRIVSVLKT